jgi:two-component system response regulator HydG
MSLKETDPHAPILVITGYSDIKTAVQVIKLGAFDYITKPLIPDEVLSILNKLVAGKQDKQNNPDQPVAVRERSSATLSSDSEYFRGKSRAAIFLHQQAQIVAATNYSVLLYGESGTGKEVVARTIHKLSLRKNKPFVALDCGTLSRELAVSELFGHIKGSFTGALQDKEGHFEMAEGGTLFLDEIGNLSMEVQAVLLRVIQERKFKRVGGVKEMPVDVRIVVASNGNLKEAYQRGKFREDLYHRLNEFSIQLPPLREREDDILPLADFFLEQCCNETGKTMKGFDKEVESIFLFYPWPGNLREFRNVIRRAVLLTENESFISAMSLPQEITQYYYREGVTLENKEDLMQAIRAGEPDLLKEVSARAEYDMIMAVLQKVNFNKKKAAELLQIDRKTLYNKLKNYQILFK